MNQIPRGAGLYSLSGSSNASSVRQPEDNRSSVISASTQVSSYVSSREPFLGPGFIAQRETLAGRVSKWKPGGVLSSIVRKVTYGFASILDKIAEIGSLLKGKVYQQLHLVADFSDKQLKPYILDLKQQIEERVEHMQARNRPADISLAIEVLSLFKERNRQIRRLHKTGDSSILILPLSQMLLASVQESKKLAPMRAKIAFLQKIYDSREREKLERQTRLQS